MKDILEGKGGYPPLMLEAMRAHGIDFERVPQATRSLARARCQRCVHADQCFAWLHGFSGVFDYQWFCANAALFNRLPQPAVRELVPRR